MRVFVRPEEKAQAHRKPLSDQHRHGGIEADATVAFRVLPSRAGLPTWQSPVATLRAFLDLVPDLKKKKKKTLPTSPSSFAVLRFYNGRINDTHQPAFVIRKGPKRREERKEIKIPFSPLLPLDYPFIKEAGSTLISRMRPTI